MINKTKLLFVGNYFSHAQGTAPVMERVAVALRDKGIVISQSSKKSFWLWRALDHFIHISFRSYSIAFIDVFSNRSFLLAEWAVFWLLLRNKKIVLTLRGGRLAEFSTNEKNRVFDLLKKADRIQTPSLFLKAFFEKSGIEIEYLPNPVDVELFSFLMKKAPPTYKLIWVRAFTEIYNPHLAILVLQKVLSSFPEATLTMIGPDRGLVNKTIDLIKKLNLVERIEIVGPVSNDKLYEYYQTHDVYLNTTSYESFGVAVVEAASCGTPVVSFRVGEIPYIWKDEFDILLAEFGNVDMMAEQVCRVFSDCDLANQLSFNGRKKAETFSWQRIGQRWLDIIEG